MVSEAFLILGLWKGLGEEICVDNLSEMPMEEQIHRWETTPSGSRDISLSPNMVLVSIFLCLIIYFHFHTSTYILTPPLSHFHTASGYRDISLSPNMVLVRGIFPFLIINFHVHTSTFTLSHFYFHAFTLPRDLEIQVCRPTRFWSVASFSF